MATATERATPQRQATSRTEVLNSLTSVTNGHQAMEVILLLDYFLVKSYSPAGQLAQRSKILNEAARQMGATNLNQKLPTDLTGYTMVLAKQLAKVRDAEGCLEFIFRLDLYADRRAKEAGTNPVNVRRGIVSQAKRFLVRRRTRVTR